jgi:hypothetical protein
VATCGMPVHCSFVANSGRISTSRCQKSCDDALVACLGRWPHPGEAGFHDNFAADEHVFHGRSASDENPRTSHS